MNNIKGTWYKNLEHDGVQVVHQSKPDSDIIERLKKSGFRWSSRQKLWYAKGKPNQIALLKEIADYGGEIGEQKSFEEQMNDKLERSKRRSEYYQQKAESVEEESESLFEEATKMADVIPFGQPIHVGHYSEGSDRRYRERIENKMKKSIETAEKAKYYQDRSKSSSEYEDRTFNLETTLRRIERLEAEWRRHYRELDDQYIRIFQGREKSISRTSLERAERIMEQIEEEITYWKKIVAQKKENGLKVWGPGDFTVGETINVDGRSAKVLKVNPKTLWVEIDAPWLGKMNVRKKAYHRLQRT